MPFFVRSVSPVRISVLPDSVRHFVLAAQSAQQRNTNDASSEPTLELELFTHESLVNVIRQLSSFCANANDLLAELNSALRSLNERGRLLGERVERIRERAHNAEVARSDASLKAASEPRRPYSSAQWDEPSRNLLVRQRAASQPNSADGKFRGRPDGAGLNKRGSRSNVELRGESGTQRTPASLFCERSTAMQSMYARAESPPALSDLNEYRDDQVDAASFYSNPAFYLNADLPSAVVNGDGANAPPRYTNGGPNDPQLAPYALAMAPKDASTTAEYDALRGGLAVATLGRGGQLRASMREDLVARMRQLRLEQTGQSAQRSSVQLDTMPNIGNGSPAPAPAAQVATKQKSVNFNLSANVVGVASSGARSSTSSTSSSTNTLPISQQSPTPATSQQLTLQRAQPGQQSEMPVDAQGQLVVQRVQVEQQIRQQAQFINPGQFQQFMITNSSPQPQTLPQPQPVPPVNGNGNGPTLSPLGPMQQAPMNATAQRPNSHLQHHRSVSQPPAPFNDNSSAAHAQTAGLNSELRDSQLMLMANSDAARQNAKTLQPQLSRQQSQTGMPQPLAATGNGRTAVAITNGNIAGGQTPPAQVNRQPIYAPVAHLQQGNPTGVAYQQPTAQLSKAAPGANQAPMGVYAGVANNNLSAPLAANPGTGGNPVDLKQAIMMNLAMNSTNANANYVTPGATAFGQPSVQMLNTIQSILTEQAIGDARAPLVVQSPLGVQLRSTMKQANASEPQQVAPGGRDRMSKELLAEIKQGVRLRRVSFADDANGES